MQTIAKEKHSICSTNKQTKEKLIFNNTLVGENLLAFGISTRADVSSEIAIQ